MPCFNETLKVKTKSNIEIVNITSQINSVIKKSEITEGSLTVFTPHTTTAITVNENEPGLVQDLANTMLDIVPKGKGYLHDGLDGNAHSHILASIIGCSVTIPVINGSPALGTWQSILFIELDGPRNRSIVVQVG